MAYPPAAQPTNRTNATPQTNTHPADHNGLGQAINDIVAELGANPSGTAATVEARLATFAQIAAGALNNIVAGTRPPGQTLLCDTGNTPASGPGAILAVATYQWGAATAPAGAVVDITRYFDSFVFGKDILFKSPVTDWTSTTLVFGWAISAGQPWGFTTHISTDTACSVRGQALWFKFPTLT